MTAFLHNKSLTYNNAILFITKIINKILEFLRFKKHISWPLLPHDLALLEKAYLKVFQPTLDCIKIFTSGGDFSVTLTYSKTDETIESKKFMINIPNDNQNGLRFKIVIPEFLNIPGVLYMESYGLSNELILNKDGRQFIVEKESVKDFHTRFPAKPQILQGTFLNFKSSNKNIVNSYRRLIIASDDTDMIYPTSILEYADNHMKFDISNWDRQSTLLGIPFLTTKGMFSELTINDNKFHFYALEQINSYIIDSVNEISEKDFKNITNSIRTCFAFLTGKFYRGEVIYLSSSISDFSLIEGFNYQAEEASIITNNQIINHTFFFGQFSEQDEATKESWKLYHKMFSVDVFSNLCEKVLDSSEIMRCIELIIKAGSINDPIQKGALYSISIETVADYLTRQNVNSSKPISNKNVWRIFLKSLKQDLDTIKNEIPTNSYKTLNSKIENLNSLTNREKLTKPFELFGIHLNDDEIEILNQRNNYLHGGSPQNINWLKELNIIALKLHYLLGLLILKYIDYRGHYINLAGWYLLNDSEIKSLIKKFDFDQIGDVLLKANHNEYKDLKQIKEAKEILENYSKFLKASIEIENLIVIIR